MLAAVTRNSVTTGDNLLPLKCNRSRRLGETQCSILVLSVQLEVVDIRELATEGWEMWSSADRGGVSSKAGVAGLGTREERAARAHLDAASGRRGGRWRRAGRFAASCSGELPGRVVEVPSAGGDRTGARSFQPAPGGEEGGRARKRLAVAEFLRRVRRVVVGFVVSRLLARDDGAEVWHGYPIGWVRKPAEQVAEGKAGAKEIHQETLA